MKTKATVPAELKPILGARVVSIQRGEMIYPAVIYAGDAPAKGATLALGFDGAIYSGVVFDATETDGETLVEFENGLSPQ